MRHAVLVPLLASLAACFIGPKSHAAELSETELRWLKSASPVIAYAKELALPLDIVVQPQASPGVAPLGLAFIGGRCKLVLSMRGNPEAQATLDRIEPALLDATVELMAAHELGHCRRYLDGAWYSVPAGFAPGSAVPPEGLSAELKASYVAMRATQREEAYGDLVGLAWTQMHHPQQYAQLHAWLVDQRSQERIPGSHHDTLAWVKLAGDGAALVKGGGFFAGPAALWTEGLELPD